MEKSYSASYAAAGVDITAGYRSVELMKQYVARTMTESCIGGLGGFGGLFELDCTGMEHPVLISGTDGVGTKLRIAMLLDKHDTIGIDCVAMCVNDVICAGAKPLVFLDYIACGRNIPEKIAEIVKGVAEGCVQADCSLVGGETAEHPGMMPEDEYDLAGFTVGVVDKEKILSNETMKPGDVILALPSTGVHSNGFSLVRKIFDIDNDPDVLKTAPAELGGKTLGEALLAPTKIYVKPVLKVLEEVDVKGIYVTSDQYNEITQKLEKYGIDVYGVGADAFTYNALLDKNTLTKDMLQVPKFSDDNGETRTEIVSVDDELYKKLCDKAGAEYGSILLLNTYQYNDNGEYVSIKPFKDDVTQISLINAANEKNTLTIGGILEQSDLKEYGFWEMTPYPVRIVVPDADARSFDWFSMPSDEDDYTEYARSVMDEYFPIVAEDSYAEQGYTVRIARTDAMVKMLNIAIVLAEIVMYGFVILLVLMGFTSVISTLTTNIRIRSREFAVLKSVGMTNKSLCRMLYSESVFCVVNALVPGVILGIAIPFLINLSIRKAFPVLYHIPWAALFGGIFVLIGIVFFITRAEIHKLRDKSIIDEIRMDIV